MLIDCHRHFGGSISTSFVWDAIVKTNAKHLAESSEDVVRAMTFAPDEPVGFQRFLNKFKILDEIPWTIELLDDSIKNVSDGLIQEGIDYCWLRFSINKYLQTLKWSRHNLIRFFAERFSTYAPGRVGLVLSLKYESQVANQRQLANLIEHPDVYDNVIGIDVVGDETYFDPSFYAPLYKKWADAGKILFAHVGESQSAQNVIDAVERMGVTDICHGLALFDGVNGQVSARQKFRDLGICYHMALTSNYLSGVCAEDNLGYSFHPIIAAVKEKCLVTVGTDDPVQCGFAGQMHTITEEYNHLTSIGLTTNEISAIKQTAIDRTAKWRNC